MTPKSSHTNDPCDTLCFSESFNSFILKLAGNTNTTDHDTEIDRFQSIFTLFQFIYNFTETPCSHTTNEIFN